MQQKYITDIKAGHDRKMSANPMHHSMLCMGLSRKRVDSAFKFPRSQSDCADKRCFWTNKTYPRRPGVRYNSTSSQIPQHNTQQFWWHKGLQGCKILCKML